jgi:hypothetical protein
MADTDVRTFRLNPNSIVFRTDGIWNVSEFSRFATAVEMAYEAFLAVHLARQSTSDQERRIQEYVYYWTQLLREERDRRIHLDEPDYGNAALAFLPNAFVALTAQQSNYLAFVYDNIHTLAPNHRLTIGKVRIGSPGWISFQGLGEPIQQLREFIKDILYRNRQERERGDMALEQERELHRLEIARQHLQLQREYGDVLAGPANRIPVAALKQSDVIERLALEGKLIDVPDNLDPSTFDPGAEKD